MEKIKQVVVYCSSSMHIADIYYQEARILGQLLAEHKIGCITGAGNSGLMGAINDSMLQSKGIVKGIIPQFMVEAGYCHNNLTHLEVTQTMHERKLNMANLSDAAIALPGGLGTLEELAEIITWKQLGLYKKPVIILNTNDFYKPLLQMFEKMIDEKFLSSTYNDLWKVVTSSMEVIDCLGFTYK